MHPPYPSSELINLPTDPFRLKPSNSLFISDSPTQRSTAVTNTDPEFDHSTGGVLGWLLTDHDLVEESNDCDPDYDNLTVECQLDESPNVDTVNRISEDEDYAESTDSEISHHSSESYDLVDEPDQSQASESEQKREILLRVLIDSGQPSKHHSQDTFYLDPTVSLFHS